MKRIRKNVNNEYTITPTMRKIVTGRITKIIYTSTEKLSVTFPLFQQLVLPAALPDLLVMQWVGMYLIYGEITNPGRDIPLSASLANGNATLSSSYI